MTIPTIHFCEPAYGVIETLGGKTTVAEHLGLDTSTLSRWCQSRPSGTGGRIPQQHWEGLLELSKQRKIRLRVQDLAGIVKIKA